MASSAVEPDGRSRARDSWAAVAAGEAFVVGAGFSALVGVFSDFELCLSGCPPDNSGLGAATVVPLALAAALLVGGMWAAAWTSRQGARAAVVPGAAATVVVAVSILLVWWSEESAGLAPGLVLGIAVAAAIAVREPTAAARYLRIAAIVVLLLASLVDDNLGLVLLALLAFPAVGAADTIALELEASRER